MNVETAIRKIARSTYWQELYHASTKMANINLFENSNNYSGLQQMFIYWLRTYALLFDELARKEWENLTESVIKDDIRCDAFLHWRKRKIEQRMSENKKEEDKLTSKNRGRAATNKSFTIYKGSTS